MVLGDPRRLPDVNSSGEEASGQLSARLDGMADFLKSRVLGQDHVIDGVVEILRLKLLGRDVATERPRSVLLFIGPNGVGKTELARALAESLYGSREKLLRFDMSEFQEAYQASKIVGAPDPIFGRGGRLADQVAENPSCVLFLEEIEKAHPAIHRLFLGVFDTGVLTDFDGRHISFSDVIVVMTVNIQEHARRGLGLGTRIEREDPRTSLKCHFTPEFVNHIDYVGVFHELRPEIVRGILEKRVIPELQERCRAAGVELEVSSQAIALIAEKGFDEKSGARALWRVVDRELVPSIARFITEGRPDVPFKLRVGVSNGTLTLTEVKEGH